MSLHNNEGGGHSSEQQQSAKSQSSNLLHRIGASTVSGNNNPANLEKFIELAKEACDQFSKQNNIRMVVTLVNEKPLALPVVTITGIVGDSAYIYSLLVIEYLKQGTIKPRMREQEGIQFEVEQPLSRLYDNTLVTNTCDHVIRKNPELFTPDTDVNAVGSTLINDKVNITDPAVVARYVDSAGLCLMSCSGRAETYTAAEVIDNGFTVVNSIEVTPGGVDINATGEPIATDFTTRMSLRKENGNSDGYHNDAETFPIVTTRGIVDMLFYPPSPMSSFQDMTGRPKPAYVPHVIATDVGGLGEAASVQEDLLGQLLGLASMATMVTGKEWLSVYNTASTKKASIGNVGYEWDAISGQSPKKPAALKVHPGAIGGNTKQDSLPPQMVAMSNFHDGIAVSMDVLLGGRLEWVQNVFVEAATGNKDATALVVRTLDSFTGGAFSEIWGNKPIMQQMKTFAFAGQFNDGKDSTPTDIRRIDYPSMLEITQGKPEQMDPFRAVSYPNPSEYALYQHKQLLKSLANVTFTGLYVRVTFVNEFFSAMLQSLQRAGLVINIEGLTSFGNTGPIVEYDAQKFATVSAPGNLFNYGAGQNHGGQYNFAPGGYAYSGYINNY